MIHLRNLKFVALSQIRLQASLQILEKASFRVRMIADDDTTVLGKSLQNVMMTILSRKIQVGIHSLHITPFHIHYVQHIVSSTSANRDLLNGHIQLVVRLP